MLGEQLKKAFADARIGHQEAADGIGVSKANLYNLFKKDTFEVEYLRKASIITGKPINYFFGTDSNKIDTSINNGKDFGGQVIGKMAEDIDNLRQTFEEQLRAKDRQIEKLLDLLGKLEGAILEPLSKLAIKTGSDYPRYLMTALKQNVFPMLRGAIFLD